MNWPDFSNPEVFYVVVCFVEESDLLHQRATLERIGTQRNVKLLVQPCPYEGLAFLFRLDHELMSHYSGYDTHVFCKALALKRDTTKAVIDQISEHYHGYFCAVLEQNEAELRKHDTALQELAPHFLPPVAEKQP